MYYLSNFTVINLRCDDLINGILFHRMSDRHHIDHNDKTEKMKRSQQFPLENRRHGMVRKIYLKYTPCPSIIGVTTIAANHYCGKNQKQKKKDEIMYHYGKECVGKA